jgi:futalosine hydrolase
MRKILLVSATTFEIQPTIDFIQRRHMKNVDVLVTGIGIFNTGFQLGVHFAKNTYDIAIHIGIAGSFKRDFELGTVVQITSERFGDLGVEEADGRFTDMTELGLIPKNYFENPYPLPNLTGVSGLTVQKVHGYQPNIDKVFEKYKPDIETMESCAFFQVCLHYNLPFAGLRGISNYVESRNRASWQIPLAIVNVNQVLQSWLMEYDLL